MLFKQILPQSTGKYTTRILPAIHAAILELLINDDRCNLRVSFTDHRAIIDVGRTTDNHTIVSDQQLGMHIDQFGNGRIIQIRMIAQTME